MFLSIILGLIGLSIVVVIHEFGHFVFARLTKVEVEAFSLGWGPRIFGKKIGKVDWRLSLLPLGGYCKMKGETAYTQALAEKKDYLPREAGSFFGASPLRRILISLGGPLFNLLFTLVVFILVAFIGYSLPTAPNKIILASENINAQPASSYPSVAAGLRSGDIIQAVNDKAANDFIDLSEMIAYNPNKALKLSVLRDGQTITINVTPKLNPDTGAGMIGIIPWVDPVIGTVVKGSSAAVAGIQVGDRITMANAVPINTTLDFEKVLSTKPEKIILSLVSKTGEARVVPLVISWNGDAADIGIGYAVEKHVTKASSFSNAIILGSTDLWTTLGHYLQGLGRLFQGINIFNAVAGPAHLTYMIGSNVTTGLEEDGLASLVVTLKFLAIISLALGVMNLLPIPVLDGGQIVLSFAELVSRRQLKLRTMYNFQIVGMVLVFSLLIIASFSDILFFMNQ